MRRWIIWIVLGGIALFLAIQLVPYGRAHTNPPTTAEPKWSSTAVRQLTKDACFDCHSNETTWPWYSNVAPVSWMTYRDVVDGRAALDFSEWNKPQDGAGDAVEAVASGSMPPWFYKPMHPKSELSQAERG